MAVNPPGKTTPEYTYLGRGVMEPAVSIKDYLFKLIAKQGPITRSEISKMTKIPRTTIYDTIVKLMLDEKLRKYPIPSKRRGRPKVFYEVVPTPPSKS